MWKEKVPAHGQWLLAISTHQPHQQLSSWLSGFYCSYWGCCAVPCQCNDANQTETHWITSSCNWIGRARLIAQWKQNQMERGGIYIYAKPAVILTGSRTCRQLRNIVCRAHEVSYSSCCLLDWLLLEKLLNWNHTVCQLWDLQYVVWTRGMQVYAQTKITRLLAAVH